MGSPPRAARTPSAERRRQLLEHAVGEFARRGLRGASTQAIAARCGLSQPYLFRLFDSKGALFLAVLEHGFDLLEAGAGATRRPDAGIAPARLRLMQRHNGELAQLFLQGCAAACDDDQVAECGAWRPSAAAPARIWSPRSCARPAPWRCGRIGGIHAAPVTSGRNTLLTAPSDHELLG